MLELALYFVVHAIFLAGKPMQSQTLRNSLVFPFINIVTKLSVQIVINILWMYNNTGVSAIIMDEENNYTRKFYIVYKAEVEERQLYCLRLEQNTFGKLQPNFALYYWGNECLRYTFIDRLHHGDWYVDQKSYKNRFVSFFV